SGEGRKPRLAERAILPGAQVRSERMSARMDADRNRGVGSARRVTTTKKTALIVDGTGRKQAVQVRIRELRAQLANGVSDYDREKLQERLANLSGGVGVIKVGAATEVEMKEKKLRMQDALSATRAALEDGVVAG